MNISQIISWLGEFRKKPMAQAVIALLLALVLQGFTAVFCLWSDHHVCPEEVWLYCPAMLLLYVLYNVLRGFFIEEMGRYYSASVYGVLMYIGLDLLWCTLLTGRFVDEVGSIGWILFVFGIVYLVFMSILNMIRIIMRIVLKQDQRAREESENWIADKNKDSSAD